MSCLLPTNLRVAKCRLSTSALATREQTPLEVKPQTPNPKPLEVMNLASMKAMEITQQIRQSIGALKTLEAWFVIGKMAVVLKSLGFRVRVLGFPYYPLEVPPPQIAFMIVNYP